MKKQAGWSLARLLLLAAVVGIAGGVLLAWPREDPRSPEQIAEEEVDKVMLAVRATDSRDMEPDPRSLAGIPPYPGGAPRKLTSRGTLKDTPAVISWFQTDDPPERVLAYYAKAFGEQNRRVALEQFSPTMGYIGWMEDTTDGGPGLLHMVSVMKQYKKTMVLLSASRPEALLDRPQEIPGGIKLPPTASIPQTVRLGEGPFANDVVYARVTNMSGPQLVEFYEAGFKEAGYEVTEKKETAAQFSVVGKRDGTTIVVGARNEGAHLSLVISYERQLPQEAMP